MDLYMPDLEEEGSAGRRRGGSSSGVAAMGGRWGRRELGPSRGGLLRADRSVQGESFSLAVVVRRNIIQLSLFLSVELGFRCFSFLHYGIAQLLVSSFYELNRSALLHSRIFRR